MANRIQIRRGTAAAWTAANPVLAAGERGFESDTGKAKTGDGSTAWTGLAYEGVDDARLSAAVGVGATAAALSTTYGPDAAGMKAAFGPTADPLTKAFVAKQERTRPLGITTQLVAGGATHLGFPYAVTAADGNVVVAWRDGANHAPSKGVIKVARYSQSMAVLTAPTTVRDDPTWDVRDPGLTVLANGNIVLAYFIYDQTLETPKLDGVQVMTSTDHGVTWGAPVTVDSAFTTWAAAAGAVVQLTNGDLLIPTYGVSAGQTYQHAHVSRSTDGGTTWAPLAVIADGDTQGSRHYQEPNIILTDKGDLLSVIRSDTTLTHFTSRSSDDGVTWTTPISAFAGNGAPRLTKQAGYIQCLHRHETTGRAVKISSGDNGVTWSNQITLPVFGAKVSSAYGVAVPYGKDSLRYIYSLQEGANNVATADILLVDSIVAEDRTAPGPVTCRAKNTAAVELPTAAWTTITFSAEDHDTAGMHSTATNTSRISATVAGYYLVKGTVYFAASTATQIQARVLKNGVTTGIPGLRDKKNPTSGQDALATASGTLYLNAGDYLELQGYQDSGAAISARFEDTVFELTLISAPV